jgi:hypothetical protein
MDKKLESLVSELNELDKELVTIDGVSLKPSQCYHFGTDPVHLLFNINCPERLKEKVSAIIAKHLPDYESGTPG